MAGPGLEEHREPHAERSCSADVSGLGITVACGCCLLHDFSTDSIRIPSDSRFCALYTKCKS
jgi:hypothetical protein